jgi:hypothetical protein
MFEKLIAVVACVALLTSGYLAMQLSEMNDQIANLSQTQNGPSEADMLALEKKIAALKKEQIEAQSQVAKMKAMATIHENKTAKIEKSIKSATGKPTTPEDLESLIKEEAKKIMAEMAESGALKIPAGVEIEQELPESVEEIGEILKIDANQMVEVKALRLKAEDEIIGMLKKEDETVDDFRARMEGVDEDPERLAAATGEFVKKMADGGWATMMKVDREYTAALKELLGDDTAKKFKRLSRGIDNDMKFEGNK